MSGISSGVGLISGINTAQLIDQLMAIESRPLNAVRTRITSLDTVRTAWMRLSASLLGMKLTATSLKGSATFEARTATSSDDAVLTATAGAGAAMGTYQFTVRRLVQTHQLISAGLADNDSTPVGAGTMYFDTGYGLVAPSTGLDFLNGQTGVARGSIRITDRAGNVAVVDLTEAMTVQDVLDEINMQPDAAVTAEVAGGVIVLHDTSGGAGNLTVANVGQGRTAADLGIAGAVADDTLTGQNINILAEGTSLDLLNDALGIRRTGGDEMRFTLRDGTVIDVGDIYGMVSEGGVTTDVTAHTLDDIIDAINDADGNAGKLVADISADGRGLTLTDTTGGAGDLVVADLNTSHAATDLGLTGTYNGGPGNLTVQGRDLIAKLNSVLVRHLDGGAGLTLGNLSIQDRAGNSVVLDLSSAQSLSDIVEAINNNGTASVQAGLNAAGNGITIIDTSGAAVANLAIADLTGNVAATLGIAVDDAVTQIAGGNAQLQYVSTETRLDRLPGRQGVPAGDFTITNSNGASVTVKINDSAERLRDVISAINSYAQTIDVTARINDTGTGIILEDAAGGANELTVAEAGGTTAAALGLLGSANEGETFLDGSFHRGVTIDADDSLEDVAKKINNAGLNVTAAIINDGSSANPYRLVLTSDISGTAGRIILDAGTTALATTTVFEPRDAMVFLGATGGANPIVLTSTDNRLEDLITGVSIDLKGTSTQPVSLTIDRNVDTVVTQVKSFTDAFNALVNTIDGYTMYDPETSRKGLLFGDPMVSLVRGRLFSMVMGTVDTASSHDRLSDVGVTLGAGNRLSFDEEAFRDAFAADPEGVTALFSQAAQTETTTTNGVTTTTPIGGTGGIGAVYEDILDNLTASYDGLITRVTDSLDDQKDALNDRVDMLTDLLAAKRARLERQFAAMETALARLQGQQSALLSLSQMASSFSLARQ